MKPFVILKQRAIASLAALLTDSITFDRVMNVVEQLDAKDVPGEMKRSAAFTQFKVIGLDIAKWLLGVMLELAVAYIRVAKK